MVGVPDPELNDSASTRAPAEVALRSAAATPAAYRIAPRR
jgi:hypothetical protein